MTTELRHQSLPEAPGTADPRPSRRPAVITAVSVVVVAAVSLSLRLIGVRTAYDVFVDEPFYVSLGRSVAAGHWVPIGSGQPFLLHPPGFFYVEAAWLRLSGFRGDAFAAIFWLRGMQQVFAAGTAVLLFMLARRVAGYRAGLVVAGIYSIDAYVLQQNSRVMLETVATTAILGGYLIMIAAVQRADRRAWPAIAAGLLFGGAALVRDTTVLVTVVPMLVIARTGWSGMRRPALIAVATTIQGYASYLLLLALTGHGRQFWDAKVGGLGRALGAHVTTGFSAADAPSLASALWNQLLVFAGSYAVIAVGVVAGMWLLVRPRTHGERIVGLYTAAAVGMIGFDLAVGTIEEQFLYYLAVPAIISATVAGSRIRLPRLSPVWTGRILATVLAMLVTVNAVSWVRIHTTTDNGQYLAHRWLEEHAPAGSTVAWVASQTDITLRAGGFRTVEAGTPQQLVDAKATYLVVLGKTVAEGYAKLPAEALAFYAEHGTKVFSFTGRSQGEVMIYQTNDPAVW